MKQAYLESLPTDELWSLHEKIAAALDARLTAEKEMLNKRLKQLKKVGREQSARAPERRPYPPVFPKFRNPAILRSPIRERPFRTAARRPPIAVRSVSGPLRESLSGLKASWIDCSSSLEGSSERYCARSGSMMLSRWKAEDLPSRRPSSAARRWKGALSSW